MAKTKVIGMMSVLLLGSSSLYAGGDFEVVEPYTEAYALPIEKGELKKYFISASGGVGFLAVDSSLENDTEFKAGTLDKTGGLFEVNAGYRFNREFFSTIAYQGTFLDIATIHNFYASINYQFDDYVLDPYFGAIFGSSTLNWNENPYLVLIDKNLTSKSLMYGVQAGLKNELKEDLYLATRVQLIKYNHQLDIRQNRSSVNHTLATNVSVGVQYEF